MTSDELRQRAEQLYEEIGGDLCICQRVDVSHWCEKCQWRIGIIIAALTAEREALKEHNDLVLFENGDLRQLADRQHCGSWLSPKTCLTQHRREPEMWCLGCQTAAALRAQAEAQDSDRLTALPVGRPCPMCGRRVGIALTDQPEAPAAPAHREERPDDQ